MGGKCKKNQSRYIISNKCLTLTFVLKSIFPTIWLTLLFISSYLITMYEFPSCLKVVYVYHFSCFWDASWFNLVCFEMALAWTKNERKKRLLFLNSLTLLHVHQNSISTIIVQMNKKNGNIGAHEGYFSLKNSARIEYLSQIKHITHASFGHVTLNRSFL